MASRGIQSGDGSSTQIDEVSYDPGTGDISWDCKLSKPMKLTFELHG